MKLQEAVKHLKRNAVRTGITDSTLFQYFYDYMTTYHLDDMYISEMEVDSIRDFIEVGQSGSAVTHWEAGAYYVFNANGKNYSFPRKNVMPDRISMPICEMNISKDLYDAIRRASMFVLRGTMNAESCVNIRFNDNTCIVTSSDGSMLVTAGYETESSCSAELNISYKAVDFLPQDYPIGIRVYDDAIHFVYSDGYAITAYSNVDKYLPHEAFMVVLDVNAENHLPYCTVNRKSLITSINKLSKLFKKPEYVWLTFSDRLDVYISDGISDHHATVDYDSNFLSGEYRYKVSLKGLISYLKACDTDLLYIVPKQILYLYAHERWAMLANCL